MTQPMRLLPAADEIFLDHVGWYVADIKRAGAVMERLGFRLTPYTVHTNETADGQRVATGTANRCAMLRFGYLEILTAPDGPQTPLGQQLRKGLARYEGLHLMALAVDDAEAAPARLAASGFAPAPPVHLRRPIPAEDDNGAPAMSAFTVIRIPPDAMAEGRIQLLTHHTPEIVWQERFIATDNHIDALTDLLICVADPAEAAARYARFTDRPASAVPGGFTIPLDRGRILLVDPMRTAALLPNQPIPAPPFIAAIGLQSTEIAATRRFLEARGIALDTSPTGALMVPAAEALGATLLIKNRGHSTF
jgi:Glyoxalase-like domain